MQYRKEPLANHCYYHIFSRSIAKYVIFNGSSEYLRMSEMLKMYRFADFNYKYSRFSELDPTAQLAIINNLNKESPVLVEIVSFCLMPTHLHLILKQISSGGISKYLGKVLNSYSRFFNQKHQRSGPLWAGRFKSVLVSRDDQLLHLTRYLHLNPTSVKLVDNPKDWPHSSYLEYIDSTKEGICTFANLISMIPTDYKKFVLDRKSYQQELSRIKNLLIDDYTG